MGSVPAEAFALRIRVAIATHEADRASDGQLVARYAEYRDQAAFAALVRRHGPMVLGVARRLLGTGPEVEDVFQATFLVLCRKAGSLRQADSVANWLYGVAVRLARRARVDAARRRRHERQASRPGAQAADPSAAISLREAQAVLDEELARFPGKYRSPLVLCCLEGLARDEAARQLGWPTGLLKSRLEQARERLHGRLAAADEKKVRACRRPRRRRVRRARAGGE